MVELDTQRPGEAHTPMQPNPPPAMPDPPLSYGRQWVDEDDIAAVVAVLRGDWLTQGPLVQAFENALAKECGARYAVATSSGTAALHIAALAAGVGPGDSGITSPISFVASANCLAYCGATPMFADVDPATITLDPSAVAKVCERRPPKVIIPVDFAGQPADLPSISEIAKRHSALVIADSAHSLGATYRHAGLEIRSGSCAHSDMAVLSFHPVKHITTGEGGAVLTNDSQMHQRMLDLRSHGITKDPRRLSHDGGPWYYEQLELGYNYRITDFQCALGLAQLSRLSTFVERRRELVSRYRELLADLGERLTLLTEVPGRRSSYHLMIGRIEGGAVRRRQVFEHLQTRGIRTQVHYIPIHLQPWYRNRFSFSPGDFPIAEDFYASCISLPLYPAMTEGDVERVSDALHEILLPPV